MGRFVLITAAALAAGGCQAVSFDQPAADTLHYDQREGPAPSLVFSPPDLADFEQYAAAEGFDWWRYRDVPAATPAGLVGPTFTRTVTFTADHQRIINGRVRDHLRTSTYTTTVRESVR